MTKLLDIEIERLQRKTYKRNQRRHSNRLMKAYSARIEQEKKNANKFLYGKEEGPKKPLKAGLKPAQSPKPLKPARKGEPASDLEETKSFNKGAEKRRRVKPGEEKKQGFSMGGMADYIKELL
tara:strand:+ start:134 stop:502 length:369 start_codon:yes stop_codon:yes gene_type:complete